MTARPRLAIVGTAAALFLLTNLISAQNQGPAQDNASARVVRLSMVNGDVLAQTDEHGFQKAFLNMPLASGARVWAREGGAAEIELENGTSIRLTPQTQIAFDELSGDDSGGTSTSVTVPQGLVYFDVRPRRGDQLSVSFGRETVVLRQRVEFRLVVADDEFEVAVLNGEVEINSDALAHVKVRQGETLALDPQDQSRYELSQQVAQDSYDGWDQDRSSYRNQYAQPEVSNQTVESSDTAPDNPAQNNAAQNNIAQNNNEDPAPQNVAVSEQDQPPADSTSYVSTDLNYYGTYFVVTGYGRVWRPRYFPANWNPYANGAWVFEAGIGYVWVSAYPWGWAPFHYGSWVYVPATGWCWHPGRHHRANWSPSVRLVNAPAGTQIPAKPTTPGKVVYVGGGLVPPRGALGFQPGVSRLPARKTLTAENTGAQRSESHVSSSGAHVFDNSDPNDPIFASAPAPVQGPVELVLVPVGQDANQNANTVQQSNGGRWTRAATSPSGFSAATSPGSFSAATSSGNRAATYSPGTASRGGFAVVPAQVVVPEPQVPQTPATPAVPAQPAANQQPYPLYHTLPAVRAVPQTGPGVQAGSPQQNVRPQNVQPASQPSAPSRGAASVAAPAPAVRPAQVDGGAGRSSR